MKRLIQHDVVVERLHGVVVGHAVERGFVRRLLIALYLADNVALRVKALCENTGPTRAVQQEVFDAAERRLRRLANFLVTENLTRHRADNRHDGT